MYGQFTDSIIDLLNILDHLLMLSWDSIYLSEEIYVFSLSSEILISGFVLKIVTMILKTYFVDIYRIKFVKFH